MNTEAGPKRLVKSAVGAAAVVFAATGLALLFAGRELTTSLLGQPAPEILASLLAASFLGFASMNWIARHNILGGIYGRAVVAGNQTSLVIGALVLVRHVAANGGSVALWIAAVLYVAGACLFSALTMGWGQRT